MQFDTDFVFSGVIQLLIVLLALSAHEAAHAWTARMAGDPTGYERGRVSLNPLRHLDIWGSVLVPVMLLFSGAPVFGWARPTPVQVSKLRNPGRDHALVTLAGPLANLLIAFGALLALAATLAALGPEARDTATYCLARDLEQAKEGQHFPLLFALVHLSFLNGFLALFNLLPVPPLDGGQLLLQILPAEWAAKYSALTPYGFMIVLVLAMLQVVWILAIPAYLLITLVIQVS